MTAFVWWLGLIMIVICGTLSALNENGATKFKHALSLILMLCGIALVASGNAGA